MRRGRALLAPHEDHGLGGLNETGTVETEGTQGIGDPYEDVTSSDTGIPAILARGTPQAVTDPQQVAKPAQTGKDATPADQPKPEAKAKPEATARPEACWCAIATRWWPWRP